MCFQRTLSTHYCTLAQDYNCAIHFANSTLYCEPRTVTRAGSPSTRNVQQTYCKSVCQSQVAAQPRIRHESVCFFVLGTCTAPYLSEGEVPGWSRTGVRRGTLTASYTALYSGQYVVPHQGGCSSLGLLLQTGGSPCTSHKLTVRREPCFGEAMPGSKRIGNSCSCKPIGLDWSFGGGPSSTCSHFWEHVFLGAFGQPLQWRGAPSCLISMMLNSVVPRPCTLLSTS